MVDGHPSEACLTADQVTASTTVSSCAPAARSSLSKRSAPAALVRMAADERTVRPGGTISGRPCSCSPTSPSTSRSSAQAGAAAAARDDQPLHEFPEAPATARSARPVRLLKVGRRLAVGEVEIVSAEDDALVAHAVATYAMPA